MNSLAERLRDTRKEKGLSQSELAKKAGIGTTTISSIEQGKSRGTTLIVPIAKALGVREEWLVEGKGKKEQSPMDGLGPDQELYIAARTPSDLAEQLLRKGDDHVLQLIGLIMQMKERRH